MKQSFKIIATLAILFGVAGCQLPDRTDGINVDTVPNLDPTLIASDNGLLAAGITTVPGSYCFAGADGKCDVTHLQSFQCLASGATIEVAPKTSPTPSYDALIDYKYAGAGNSPIVAATTSAEFSDEVKAVISGTAIFSAASPNNGYPGIDGLRACILHNNGSGSYGTVFWISAANILDVTIQHFKQVSSSGSVTGTGFGFNGSTYNHNGTDEEKIWIGLQASAINVGTIPAPVAPAAVAVHTLARGLAVDISPTVERLPNRAMSSFVH
jgi:hypothetical protein